MFDWPHFVSPNSLFHVAYLPCTTQVYTKITQKRYRDVSVVVRSAALDGLSKIMLALPDIYVQVRQIFKSCIFCCE